MVIKKILIANQFGIGDVLFTFPMISAIRKSHPQANIGYLCNRRTEAIVKDNPDVNDIFIYEKDELRRRGSGGYFKGVLKLKKEIKNKKYDIAFDLTLSRLFGFLFFLAGIKRRIGYDYKGRGIFLTDKIKINGYHDKHMVLYYADLLKFVNIELRDLKMELFVKNEDKIWADNLFKQNKIGENDTVVAIIPGGGASWGKDAIIKQWDKENFAKVADELNKKRNAKIILMGSAKDKTLCDRIKEILHDKAIDITGKTTLGQFAATLKKCKLAVCNDGGPLHVAVCAGIKTVSIFGPVDEKVYGPLPLGGNHLVAKADIVCRPCYKNFKYKKCQGLECLKNVPVGEVIKACEKLLGES